MVLGREELVGGSVGAVDFANIVETLRRATIGLPPVRVIGERDELFALGESGESPFRLGQERLVPWIFDYYTKLDFSPAHKIHKIHALRMVSASSALSSFFCYRGLVRPRFLGGCRVVSARSS